MRKEGWKKNVWQWHREGDREDCNKRQEMRMREREREREYFQCCIFTCNTLQNRIQYKLQCHENYQALRPDASHPPQNPNPPCHSAWHSAQTSLPCPLITGTGHSPQIQTQFIRLSGQCGQLPCLVHRYLTPTILPPNPNPPCHSA